MKAITVLCAQCEKWIHGRCAGMKRVAAKFSSNFACRKREGTVGEAVVQEETLCVNVETVWEFPYLYDSVGASEGCEAAVAVRTRRWWVKFRECGEMFSGVRYPLKLFMGII